MKVDMFLRLFFVHFNQCCDFSYSHNWWRCVSEDAADPTGTVFIIKCDFQRQASDHGKKNKVGYFRLSVFCLLGFSFVQRIIQIVKHFETNL